MRRRKKRPLILFELVISLSLIAILMTVLFRFFVNCVSLDLKIDRARTALHTLEKAQTRLSILFTSLVPGSTLPHPLPSFYTVEEGSTSLVTLFDNGIDPDPVFCGPVLCKLFLDPENNLSLALWPLNHPNPQFCRQEILLPQVKQLHFQFLTLAQLGQPEWRTTWSKTSLTTPSVIRLQLGHQGRDLNFAFHLPISEPISFQEEKSAI